MSKLNRAFQKWMSNWSEYIPSADDVLLPLFKLAVDQEDDAFGYPIYNFKFDKTLFPQNNA